MSWLSSRAVRRHSSRRARPALLELEKRVNPTNVLQYHMDSLSTGVNNTETVLTRSNVNYTTFGKLWSVRVQGQVYAEPLIETGVNITTGANQGVHNVVFVATEHDQLYAYDADAATPTLLWQRSFLSDALNTNQGDLLAGNTGVTTVPSGVTGSGNVTVEIGITGTPVIDPNTGTIYLVAKTAETVSGTVHYVQRLYAVNIQTGVDQTAPYLLGDTTGTGPYTDYAAETTDPNRATKQIYVYGAGYQGEAITDPYNGTGRSVVQFNALREAQRPALNLANGVVFIGWASHGDNGPYHGWVVGVSAYTAGTPNLTLKGVLNTTPNGGLGGIWQGGGALTFDGTYLYFESGNGSFDGNNGTGTGGNPPAPAPGPITGLNNAGFPINGDYGDSFVKVAFDPTSTATNQNRTTGLAGETANSNGWGFKVVDYFTPFNQNWLNATDLDVGSSAVVVVPDYIPNGPANQFASASMPRLLVGSGKEGVIYLMNRDNMGKYGLTNNIVQNTANQLSGSLDSAGLFNGRMYYVEGYGGVGKTFTFSNGTFSLTPETRSPDAFAYAGSTPTITANGTSNGIVWDVDRGTNQLRAYSSDSYATELYTSAQAPGGRDALGPAVTFQVATAANGRVYVGAGTGDPNNVLDVYGLLPPPTGAPNAPTGLVAQPTSSTQINLAWTDNSGSPNFADGFYVEESPNGSTNWTQIAVLTGTNPGYLVTGLTAATPYYFRVRAHNGFGFSGYTNVSAATTPPAGSHSIDYSGGFTTANTTASATQGGLAFNGATQAELIPGNGRLQLTSGLNGQDRSVYFTNPQADPTHVGKQDIVSFSTTFTYVMNNGGNPADGVTFVIQNTGLTALGGAGGGLGYSGITPSFAFAINVYGGNAIGTEILINGVVDEAFTETNINTQLANTPITVTIGYASGVVTVEEQQTINSVVQTDTKTAAVNIPGLLGANYAYVGFTGATGGANSTQEITSWTFDQGLVPAPPANLAATVTGYTGTTIQTVPLGAHLTWTAVTDTPPAGGAVSYKILRKLTAGGTYAQIGASSTNSFDDTGLTAGSTYFYQVQATDTYGDSLPSAEVSITTPTLAPTPTKSQTNSITDTSIAFQWQDNANNENGYLITRSVNGGTFAILANLPPDTNPAPSTMTYTDTGLTPGTTYDYHIQSYTLAGYSDFAGVTATTTATAPTNLAATSNSGSIGLTWNGVGGSGATYNVYRGTSPGGEDPNPIATGLTLLSYTDSSLSYGTTYYYKVTATVAGVERAASNEASAFATGPTAAHLQVNPNPATVLTAVSLQANVTSAGGTPHAGSIQFFDGANLLATVALNNFGFASYQTTFSAGTHNLTAVYGGTAGFAASAPSPPVAEVISAPPTVANIQVNDGSAQRSELRSITVTFSGPVTFSAGAAAAFHLVHVQDGALVATTASVFPDAQGRTVVILGFSGSETDPVSGHNGNGASPSLADGRYQLTIDASMVTDTGTGLALDGTGAGTPGANYVSPTDTLGGGPGQLHLYRLFGDVNGDGVVDQQDLGQFRSAFNTSSGNPLYISFLDADNDTNIDQLDLGQFRTRFNLNVF
jgi:fibronectin type 3 domain-containing protein